MPPAYDLPPHPPPPPPPHGTAPPGSPYHEPYAYGGAGASSPGCGSYGGYDGGFSGGPYDPCASSPAGGPSSWNLSRAPPPLGIAQSTSYERRVAATELRTGVVPPAARAMREQSNSRDPSGHLLGSPGRPQPQQPRYADSSPFGPPPHAPYFADQSASPYFSSEPIGPTGSPYAPRSPTAYGY